MTVWRLRGREPGEGLVTALGSARAAALGDLLTARLAAWARASFPDAGAPEVEGGLGDALAAVLASPPDDDGPIVIVAPELGVWPVGVGHDALEDLAAGCALSFGPMFDGSLYLLALAPAALGPLRAESTLDFGGPAVLTGLVELAERAGLQVGMARTERGLRRAADVRAWLVDPLTDGELRAALG